MKSKIYDTHVHFDMRDKKPYNRIKERIGVCSIDKCVLILNTQEEEEAFWKQRGIIREDKIVAAIAGILDIRDDRTLAFIEKAKQEKLNIIVKIHPRMTRIKRNDFENVYEIIKKTGIQVVLIDDFIYGPEVESHVGTELSIYLAQRLPKIKFVLAHAGGCDMLKTFLLTRPLKNIYYDYSLTCNYLEGTSVHQDLINGLRNTNDRIMFGTDFPDFRFEEAIRATRKLCFEAGLNKEQEENVFYYNALGIYGGELDNV